MAQLETKKIIALKAMILEGFSLRQISKALGISENTVGRYRKRLKNGYVPPVGMNEKKEAVIKSLHQYIPVKEIVKIYGVSSWTVYQTLNELQDKGLLKDYKSKLKAKPYHKKPIFEREPEREPEPEKLPENPTIDLTYETYGDTKGGKTLLEDFAAVALSGILGNVSTDIKRLGFENIAENAFRLGFEMLKQAEKYRKIYKDQSNENNN
jgi:transposase